MNGAVGGNALQTQLIALAVVLIVVVRFLVRELRARTVRVSTMWLRPAFLGALTVFFAASAVRQSAESAAELALSLTVGVAFGAVVGFLVAASTTVERAGAPGVLRLRGSWVTVAIWVAALLGAAGRAAAEDRRLAARDDVARAQRGDDLHGGRRVRDVLRAGRHAQPLAAGLTAR